MNYFYSLGEAYIGFTTQNINFKPKINNVYLIFNSKYQVFRIKLGFIQFSRFRYRAL